MSPQSEYERFESSSLSNRRLLRQEELILEVTEALAHALSRQGVKKAELAERLGKSKAFVSHVMSGSRNLTLRTLADLADAVECRVTVRVERVDASRSVELFGKLEPVAWPTKQDVTTWSCRAIGPEMEEAFELTGAAA